MAAPHRTEHHDGRPHEAGSKSTGAKSTGAKSAGSNEKGPTPVAVPEEAYAAALASLPGIGPARLRALCARLSARAAWHAVCEGTTGTEPWRDAASRVARTLDVASVWKAHREAGVEMLLRGAPGYPRALEGDPEAPAVLFSIGDPRPLDARARVALVGTRSATRYGLGVAAQLGADLAAAGVVVVSGLALGIDGAAHEGAVAAWCAAAREAEHARGGHPRREQSPSDPPVERSSRHAGEVQLDQTSVVPMPELAAAPPVAVVAGSLAAPYPPQHASLWRRVAAAGAILSEAPLNASDLAWRFPMRNRIIAALADVVVVVESHANGGAMHTVHAAAARGIPVGAVPGSVRSPASAGTNELLADGCFVVRDAADVLVALGLATASAVPVRARSRRQGAAGVHERATSESRPAQGREKTGGVLDALGWEPASLDELTTATGRRIDEVAVTLERLRRLGLVEGIGGVWRRV